MTKSITIKSRSRNELIDITADVHALNLRIGRCQRRLSSIR